LGEKVCPFCLSGLRKNLRLFQISPVWDPIHFVISEVKVSSLESMPKLSIFSMECLDAGGEFNNKKCKNVFLKHHILYRLKIGKNKGC
jgi:hypothetical protein